MISIGRDSGKRKEISKNLILSISHHGGESSLRGIETAIHCVRYAESRSVYSFIIKQRSKMVASHLRRRTSLLFVKSVTTESITGEGIQNHKRFSISCNRLVNHAFNVNKNSGFGPTGWIKFWLTEVNNENIKVMEGSSRFRKAW